MSEICISRRHPSNRKLAWMQARCFLVVAVVVCLTLEREAQMVWGITMAAETCHRGVGEAFPVKAARIPIWLITSKLIAAK